VILISFLFVEFENETPIHLFRARGTRSQGNSDQVNSEEPMPQRTQRAIEEPRD
jgi:hypothetical protein